MNEYTKTAGICGIIEKKTRCIIGLTQSNMKKGNITEGKNSACSKNEKTGCHVMEKMRRKKITLKHYIIIPRTLMFD